MESGMSEFLIRLEAKVDDMAEAVKKLVIVEERQSAQSERIGRLEARQEAFEKEQRSRLEATASEQRATDKRVDRLWYMSLGAVGVVSALLEAARAIWGHG